MNQGLSFSQAFKLGATQLLLVDENADDCALATYVLSRELSGIEVIRAGDEDTFALSLREPAVGAVITEYKLSWTDGFHILNTVRRIQPKCPVVMFTGAGSDELARRALKGGFTDYVAKSPRGYLRLAMRMEDCLQSPPAARSESDSTELSSASDQSMELLHAVSHDLQEPLRGIFRFGRLLEEKLNESDPEIKRYLHHVVEASDRMRDMLDDYLEYLNVGKDRQTIEDTDLEAAVDSAIGNLRARIEESGAVIKRGKLPTVAAGFNDMVRLFQNLLENALKFRSQAPPQLEVGAQRMQAVWLLSVKDNGIGIDRADFQRVFQMHRRLHSVKQFPGNGMGLAICKRIVEGYGGRIWVDSQPGVGSTFQVTLPTASESISEATFETA